MNALSGISAKINRAGAQLSLLGGTLKHLVDAEIYKVVGTNEPALERYAFRVEGPEMPVDVPLLAGEIVHHLRSTLDHLAWALVVSNGGVPSRNTNFPICDTEQKFTQALSRGALTGASSDAIATIRSMQPFLIPDPKEHLLGALQSLNNKDKHQLLLVLTTAMVTGDRIEVDGGSNALTLNLAPAATGNPLFAAVEEGREVQWVSYTPGSPGVVIRVNFKLDFVFEELAGGARDVMKTLTTMHLLVHEVVRRLAAFIA